MTTPVPDFEVFSVSSEADPDDGYLILVLDGRYGDTPGSFQFKIEGVKAKLTQTPGLDVLAYDAAAGKLTPTVIKEHSSPEVSPDGSTVRWTLEAAGGPQAVVMTLEVVQEFLRHMEAAIGPPLAPN